MFKVNNFKERQTIELFGRFVIIRTKKKLSLVLNGFIDSEKKRSTWYIKKFNKVVKSYFNDDKTISILGLGMGLGMIAYLPERYKIDFVEPNHEIIEIARHYYKMFSIDNVDKIYPITAERYLSNGKNTKRYDVVFYDIFNDNQVYYDALDIRYIKLIKRSLKDKGILVINSIDTKSNIDKQLNYPKETYYHYDNWLAHKIKQNAIIVIKKDDL